MITKKYWDWDIAVEFGEMNSTISKLENDIKDLETSIKKMKESITELNKTWDGQNHADFVSKFDMRCEDIEKFTKTLKNYKNALSLIKKQYESVENQVSSLI